jgi:hypothetical protein
MREKGSARVDNDCKNPMVSDRHVNIKKSGEGGITYSCQWTGKTRYVCVDMSIFLYQCSTASRPPPSPLNTMVNDKTNVQEEEHTSVEQR